MYKKILKIRRGKSDYSPFSNFPLPFSAQEGLPVFSQIS